MTVPASGLPAEGQAKFIFDDENDNGISIWNIGS